MTSGVEMQSGFDSPTMSSMSCALYFREFKAKCIVNVSIRVLLSSPFRNPGENKAEPAARVATRGFIALAPCKVCQKRRSRPPTARQAALPICGMLKGLGFPNWAIKLPPQKDTTLSSFRLGSSILRARAPSTYSIPYTLYCLYLFLLSRHAYISHHASFPATTPREPALATTLSHPHKVT
jgi:hypothetical protein